MNPKNIPCDNCGFIWPTVRRRSTGLFCDGCAASREPRDIRRWSKAYQRRERPLAKHGPKEGKGS
jgi:hypothetical protein